MNAKWSINYKNKGSFVMTVGLSMPNIKSENAWKWINRGGKSLLKINTEGKHCHFLHLQNVTDFET